MSYRPSSPRRAVPARAGSARARAVASSRAIEVDGISVTVTRKRIRNMYLRVKPPTGVVEVSAPMRMAERRIREFVGGRREWIVAQRERIAQARRLVVEEMAARAAGEAVAVPLEGLDDVGMPSSSSSPSSGASSAGPDRPDRPYGPDRPDKSGAGGPDGPNGSDAPTSGPDGSPDGSPAGAPCDHAIVWTDERRRLAAAAIEAALPDLLAKWGPIVGRSPAHITLRLMTSRWGSCTPKTKRIRLNLQLGLMEPRFLEYVLVHEMTHLWEHGHGPGFRARMDAYLPGWRDLRRELNRRAVL